ncbi:nucleotidyltransferase family protein [Labrenzia sp. DG1229]|uniref:nucleotidyltransferase family protein n=1 Tax=Labrenzia sp. DG1229 TaxID=681847 RepID=UPI00048AEB8B|nr:nucleotidyltransferase family protein [Labrenzia sp. DG1229]
MAHTCQKSVFGAKRALIFAHRLLPPLDREQKNRISDLLLLGNNTTWASEIWHNSESLHAIYPAIEVHRLHGALEHVLLKQHYSGDVSEIWNKWRVLFAESRDAIVASHREFDIVQEFLWQKGIPSYGLKGVLLGRHYYPDVAIRPMSDVDILIPTRQSEAAILELQRAGYAEELEQEYHGTSKTLHLPQLIHPDRGIVVELHTQIARDLDLNCIVNHFSLPPPSVGNAVSFLENCISSINSWISPKTDTSDKGCSDTWTFCN